ncbi:hypothetical protein [Deinococcus depolymerans]
MKKLIPLTLLALTATTAGAQSLNGVQLGLTGGYASGLSGEIFVLTPNVVGPVGVKVGVATTRAADAINDDSDIGSGKFSAAKANGATESGMHTVTSMDATYSLGEVAPGVNATLYGGGRYGAFNATESYGNSGSVTYSTNSFGVGAGAMVNYALTGNLGLVGDLGVDHFFKNTINTTTSTGGSDSFTTTDAGYQAIDNRFVRPGTNFKARVGVTYNF